MMNQQQEARALFEREAVKLAYERRMTAATKEIEAYEALGDLIAMAQQSKSYRAGVAYASVAMVWARRERERLSASIRRNPDIDFHETETR